MHMLICLDRVEVPASLVSHVEKLEALSQGAPLRRHTSVPLSPIQHDGGAETQHDGGQEESEPEADEFGAVHHADLAEQGADVDEHVEVVVHTGGGDGRVDDHPLAGLGESYDRHGLKVELLNDEGVHVGLEATGAETHSDETDDEGREGTALVRV